MPARSRPLSPPCPIPHPSSDPPLFAFVIVGGQQINVGHLRSENTLLHSTAFGGCRQECLFIIMQMILSRPGLGRKICYVVLLALSAPAALLLLIDYFAVDDSSTPTSLARSTPGIVEHDISNTTTTIQSVLCTNCTWHESVTAHATCTNSSIPPRSWEEEQFVTRGYAFFETAEGCCKERFPDGCTIEEDAVREMLDRTYSPSENATPDGDDASNHTRNVALGAEIRGSDFLPSLQNKAHPMWKVISGSPGVYNRCGDTQPITWMLLSGHIRTMHDHMPNLMSFLNGSSQCWFVVVFTRNELTGDSAGHNVQCEDCKSMAEEYNVTHHLVGMQREFTTNFAYVVCERNFESQWIGDKFSPEWPGVTMAAQLVAKHHAIWHNPENLAILSRPDIIVSHSIQTKPLHELAATRNASFLVPHESKNFGTGNDPSEVWVLMPWSLLVGMCDLSVSLAPCGTIKNASQCLAPLCLANFTTSPDRCGHWYKRVLSAGTSHMNASAYYIRPGFKVHFHRLTGELWKAVNAPGSRTIKPGNKVDDDSLDLMKHVGCEYSPSNVCNTSAHHLGSTVLVDGSHPAKYTATRYGGFAYVCTERYDL